MVKWFGADWSEGPSDNVRLNPFVIDFTLQPCQLNVPAMVAAKAAVDAVVAQYPAPYTLLASGGVDSQIMLWAWKLSGVPFKVVHYSYCGGLNMPDTTSLVEFCSNARIDFEVRQFDAFDFIKSYGCVDYAKQFDCASPHISTYMKLVEQHPNETVVMSGNFITGAKCGINYTIYGLERYAQQEKPNFVPFFLLSSPELAYAFWNQEQAFWLATGTPDDYLSKIYAYRHAGVPVVPQSKKLTGFEQMKAMADSFVVDPKLRIKYNRLPSKRPFDLLYRYALFDHIPLYTETTVIKHNPCIKE